MLVSGSERGVVRFWNITNGDSHAEPSDTMTKISSVHWMKNGKAVISGSYDQSLRLWDPNSGKNLSLWLAHMSGVSDFVMSEDGNFLVSTGAFYDTTIKFWSLNHASLLKKLCAIANTEDFTACK